MKLKNLLSLGAILCAYSVSAQVSFDGQIKPRTEFRNGYSFPITPNQNYALFTDQRTRLNFGYDHKDIKTMISIQDVRYLGCPELEMSKHHTTR